MSGVKSVLLAIGIATDKRDQAGKALIQLQRAHVFAQDQMAQLEVYASETEARWAASAKISTTPELMRHHYQFMDRLHQAVGMQSGVLENSNRKVALAQRLALEAEFRLRALQQVLKKKQADMAALQARREQKQMDEFAALRRGQSQNLYSNGEPS